MNKRVLAGTIAIVVAVTACSSADEDVTSSASTATTEGTIDAVAPSGLDSSFGVDGVLATPLSATDDDRFILVEGADGLIYTSGFTAMGEDHAFAVSRFNPDGTPDESFGSGGTAVVNVAEGGGGAEVGRGIVVEDDGSVLVTGPFEKDPAAEGDAAKDLDIAVVRLDDAGALDPGFGEGGIFRIDLGPGKVVDPETYRSDNAWGLTARDGGYAVFASTPNQAAERIDTDYAVVGLTDSGILDPAFGTDGLTIVDVGSGGDTARTIAPRDDGMLVATGYSTDDADVVSPVLIRMTPDGALDETFGDAGVANHVLLSGVAESYNWAAQGDDYILAGYGRDEAEETVDLLTYRFLADGSWDRSFGTDGLTRIDLAGQDDRGRNVTVLPDGNIMVVGSGKLDATNIDAMVVMLDGDGTPVETFGEDGHLLVDLGGPADGFFGVTVTDDERDAIIAGFSGADPAGTGNDDAALARLEL